MKLSKKAIIISSIAIVSLVILIAVAAIIKTNVNKPKNLLKVLQESVDLQIKGFVYTEVGEANAKWEVKADTATYNKKQNLAVLEKVQIKLTTSDGKVFTMSADKGQMFTDKKNIEIKGNVVITSDNDDRFSTDHLNYNDAEKKFYTDAPVTMENKRMKLTGTGLTLSINNGKLSIPSMVKAKIN
ncbi:MAG: LPS export ABC transporter periplasmic protein LptC [Deltaproteobacteria bacterium HGW-Deltaproteobacteria-13]|jgi:LPS export ABC transporter protein LptC|nr:MAG: LPS export ABC transporter periplasmic protein LptC [Deltaproteobacteria bacterium HGW-Deltaproteobacteria-13]